MALTLQQIRAEQRKQIFLQDLAIWAEKVRKQSLGKYLTYCKLMGYELDENGSTIELIQDDEILNGLIGLQGNSSLIEDWID